MYVCLILLNLKFLKNQSNTPASFLELNIWFLSSYQAILFAYHNGFYGNYREPPLFVVNQNQLYAQTF